MRDLIVYLYLFHSLTFIFSFNLLIVFFLSFLLIVSSPPTPFSFTFSSCLYLFLSSLPSWLFPFFKYMYDSINQSTMIMFPTLLKQCFLSSFGVWKAQKPEKPMNFFAHLLRFPIFFSAFLC